VLSLSGGGGGNGNGNGNGSGGGGAVDGCKRARVALDSREQVKNALYWFESCMDSASSALRHDLRPLLQLLALRLPALVESGDPYTAYTGAGVAGGDEEPACALARAVASALWSWLCAAVPSAAQGPVRRSWRDGARAARAALAGRIADLLAALELAPDARPASLTCTWCGFADSGGCWRLAGHRAAVRGTECGWMHSACAPCRDKAHAMQHEAFCRAFARGSEGVRRAFVRYWCGAAVGRMVEHAEIHVAETALQGEQEAAGTLRGAWHGLPLPRAWRSAGAPVASSAPSQRRAGTPLSAPTLQLLARVVAPAIDALVAASPGGGSGGRGQDAAVADMLLPRGGLGIGGRRLPRMSPVAPRTMSDTNGGVSSESERRAFAVLGYVQQQTEGARGHARTRDAAVSGGGGGGATVDALELLQRALDPDLVVAERLRAVQLLRPGGGAGAMFVSDGCEDLYCPECAPGDVRDALDEVLGGEHDVAGAWAVERSLVREGVMTPAECAAAEVARALRTGRGDERLSYGAAARGVGGVARFVAQFCASRESRVAEVRAGSRARAREDSIRVVEEMLAAIERVGGASAVPSK